MADVAPASTHTDDVDAFGDESADARAVVYGVLALPRAHADLAVEMIAATKREFGCDPNARLHCREIIPGHLRAKGAFAHLKRNDVTRLYKLAITRLRALNPRFIAALAWLDEFPLELPATEMSHVDPNFRGPGVSTKRMSFGPKQLAAFAAQAATMPLSKRPGFDRLQFWADRDDTQIEWMDGNRQAIRAIDGFIDLGPGKEPARIPVMPPVDPPPVLLEIADAIAYFGRRQMTAPDDLQARSIYRAMRVEEIKFGRAPDGGFRFLVPNESL